jgi:hypothetical protein
MVIHFDTQNLAIDHLRKSDFRKLENGRWLSPDKKVLADITPAFGSVVRVIYSEVGA